MPPSLGMAAPCRLSPELYGTSGTLVVLAYLHKCLYLIDSFGKHDQVGPPWTDKTLIRGITAKALLVIQHAVGAHNSNTIIFNGHTSSCWQHLMRQMSKATLMITSMLP